MNSPLVNGFLLPETVIYNSRRKAVLMIVFAVVFMVLGTIPVFFLRHKHTNITLPFTVGVVIIIGIYYIAKNTQALLDKEPQLILTTSGITVQSLGFIPWAEIRDIAVREEKSGDAKTYSLYIVRGGLEHHVNIAPFDIKCEKLNELVAMYRNKQQQQHSTPI